jgi:hypothetical protein
MWQVSIRQGEQKPLYFTIIKDGLTWNLTGATFTLKIYDDSGTLKITKNDADFTKTDISIGKISVQLTSEDLDLPVDPYYGKLQIILGELIDKTVEFILMIQEG